MKYYLKADSYTSITGRANPNDNWDRDDTATSWSIHSDYLYEGETYHEVDMYYDCHTPELKVGDRPFVVVAIWSTGNSFGYDENYYAKIVHINLNEQDARAWVEEALKTKDLTMPWNGYFEHLTSIDIYNPEFVVNEKKTRVFPA